MTRRLAAVDVGSNTVHVLVADVAGGHVDDVAYFVETPALGAEVERTGRIGPAKTAEAVTALTAVLSRAAEVGYERLVAGATAAVRRAEDREEFLAAASAAAGTEVRLIDDEREAHLSFEGAASRHAGRHGWLLADVGGGSTELVAAEGREIRRWVSLAVGSGSLAARHLSDPPRLGEREALRAAAIAEIGRGPECDAQKLVVTGGTASHLPLVVSPDRPPAVLTRLALLTAADRLDAGPASKVATRLGLPEPRVRALRAGAELLLLLLDRYRVDRLHVSLAGLRHGMLLAFAEQGEEWWR